VTKRTLLASFGCSGRFNFAAGVRSFMVILAISCLYGI
jgi:hypothetical protein